MHNCKKIIADANFSAYDSNMKYIDAHCHMITAPNAEIACAVCDATCESDWDKVIEIANSETIFACIGVHPWYIDSITPCWESRMRKKLAENPSVMIGEIGIDKYKPNIDLQIRVFTEQIEIAAELNRPVHIHCVGAWDKVLHILKSHSANLPPMILAHRFDGNRQIIDQICHDYNVYFSYSLDCEAERVRNTPVDRILVESDAFDADTQISRIVATTGNVANILNLTPDEVTKQTYENFQRMISYVRPIE